MTPNQQRFLEVMKEILEIDKADLDFGIYRIMNQKRGEIEKYLNHDLLPQIQKSLQNHESDHEKSLRDELEQAIKNAEKLGVNPDDTPKVKELKKQLANKLDVKRLEEDVFSHLATFFGRYYEGGDFISKRRYKEGTYAIPYEGEEVKLYWANHDQYYIKSSENLINYTFTLDSGRKVVFRVVSAPVEKDNTKINDAERELALDTEQPFLIEKSKEKSQEGLLIRFVWQLVLQKQKKKQSDMVNHLCETIQAHKEIDSFVNELRQIAGAGSDRNVLEKHLYGFSSRHSFDYFIHKDLGGFLRRELDYYLKTEVMFLDNLATDNEVEAGKYLAQLRTIKKTGKKIINLLSQMEEFQKRMWLKKKFVFDTQYCITLDRILEEFYDEIVKNDKQREEWVKLYAIDEIKSDVAGRSGYSKPLKVEFLKENHHLMLDTSLFDEAFKQKLIANIKNLDESLDGLLVHGDNFHALNLMQERYREQVKCVYIDPPYNAKSSEILYKNNYRHSSWLSLMNDRILLGKKLQSNSSVLVNAIDEVEQEYLGQILTQNYVDYEKNCIVVNHNPSGQQGDNFSYTHEYAYFVYPKPGRYIREQIRENEKDWDKRNFRDVTGDDSLRKTGPNCFYPIYIRGEEIVGFGDICESDYHPDVNENMPDNRIAIYPIDPQGIERKWRFARDTVKSIKDELKVHYIKQRDIYDIERLKKNFNFKSNWFDAQYSANNHGTQLLNQIIPKAPASYPKSLWTVKDCLLAALNKTFNEYVLDYFAGSGTTAHAVINLNREDQGSRKYILVEMGDYFDTVLKPRIQRVIYSKDWKDGKPVDREGISHAFKTIRLESYEDVLNNLEVKELDLFEKNASPVPEDYILNYMLDLETKNSASLLKRETFAHPFDFQMKITRNNEISWQKIDLVETFHWLLGLIVEKQDVPYQVTYGFSKTQDGRIMAVPNKKEAETEFRYQVVTGHNNQEKTILIIWRNLTENARKDDAALLKFIEEKNMDVKSYDHFYANGDCTLKQAM